MVLYLLQLEATLANCTNLQLENGFDHPSHQYHFELVCEREHCSRKVEANVSYDTRFPFPLDEDYADADSVEEYNSNSSYDEEEREKDKIECKKLIIKLRENIPNVHFSHSCECGNVIWVVMKLGYGSPLEVPAAYIDPGLSMGSGLTTTVMAFEVAGAEPINYKLGGGWQVEMVGGNARRTFQEIDLSDVVVNLGEKAQLDCPVMIWSTKASFVLSDKLVPDNDVADNHKLVPDNDD